MRQRHHDVFRLDQVFGVQVLGAGDDFAAALVGVELSDVGEFLRDDFGHPTRLVENIEQVGDLVHRFAVFGNDLVLLQRGQALQAQFKNLLGLRVRQPVALFLQAKLGRQPVGPVRRTFLGTRKQFLHQLRTPEPCHQFLLGISRRRRRLDQRNDFIDIGQRDCQAFEYVPAVPRFAQFEHCAAGHHLAAMAQEGFEELFQVEHARLAIDQRDHVHAETLLHLRVFPQIVQDDFRHFAAFQLNDSPHAGLVGLVTDIGDAFQSLLAHQLADFHQQVGLVDLVWQLVDDDRHAPALFRLFEMGAGAHDHAASTGAITVAHTGYAIDDACGREIRRRHDLDQFVDGDFRFFQQRLASIDHFAEVMRRDVGGHAHRDARGPVDQQVRHLGRQRDRLFFLAVIVVDEIDGVHVDVGEHVRGDFFEPALGVTISRSGIAVDRTEVALPVDQHVAH